MAKVATTAGADRVKRSRRGSGASASNRGLLNQPHRTQERDAGRAIGASQGRRQEVWQLLTELLLVMRGHWMTAAANLDLTPAQAMALRWLEPQTPAPMSALAELLACDASNVTGIVDKLEARGLIARVASDHDRRVKMLTVTAKGARMRVRLIERLAQKLAAISDDDSQTMCLLLRKLLAPEPKQEAS